MGWTLTGLASRAAAALGRRPQWADPYAAAHAAGRAQRGSRPGQDTVFERVYQRRLTQVSGADRKALEVARAAVGEDGPVIERAAATGAPVAAVAALAAAWDGLPATARDAIRDPAGPSAGVVRWGTVPATQVDGTTCGAAVLAVMAMRGDPFLAAWLMTGRAFADYVPPEAFPVVAGQPEVRTIQERWHALQRVLHERVTRGAIAGLRWPRRFGTPPWRIDDVARLAGLRFRGAMLDDANASEVEAAMAHVRSALRDGIPVPMYTGGDSTGGLSHVVPRHVVLVVGAQEDSLAVYEPSRGVVETVEVSRLHGGGDPHTAFGHWSRVCWLVLPRPARAH